MAGRWRSSSATRPGTTTGPAWRTDRYQRSSSTPRWTRGNWLVATLYTSLLYKQKNLFDAFILKCNWLLVRAWFLSRKPVGCLSSRKIWLYLNNTICFFQGWTYTHFVRRSISVERNGRWVRAFFFSHFLCSSFLNRAQFYEKQKAFSLLRCSRYRWLCPREIKYSYGLRLMVKQLNRIKKFITKFKHIDA